MSWTGLRNTVVLLWLAGSPSPGYAAELTTVTYGTPARVSLTSSGLYMAEALGFFRDEGIDLKTVSFDGTSVLLPQIANKSITIGYAALEPVVITHDEGRSALPLVFFYNATRLYNWEFVVPKDSPIKTLADLRGKTVGVITLNAGNVPVTKSIMKEVGLEVGNNVDLVAVGQGPAAMNTFRTGRIDALNEFDVPHAQIEVEGTAIRRLDLPPAYRTLPGNSFLAHADTIRDHPDLIEKFGRAYSKGLYACSVNPEGCVKMYWKINPSMQPIGDGAKALADNVKILRANLRYKWPAEANGKLQWGAFDQEPWSTELRILLENGLIKSDKINMEALYTNKFVERFGAFDVRTVEARARAIK